MNSQRIFTKTFVLGAHSLFVLALVPGQAQAFNPQPEQPAARTSTSTAPSLDSQKRK